MTKVFPYRIKEELGIIIRRRTYKATSISRIELQIHG